MPDPAVVKPAVQYLIRGAFSMVADEVRGAYRRKQRPEAIEFSDLEIEAFPSLDNARLGDTLAPGEAGDGEPLPDDLFGCVVGLEYELRVLRRVVTSDTPLHALIIGPPGCAKSLMLEELRRLPETRYIVGRNMTSSGLLELFVENPNPPRLLLIDEIEKSDPSTLATLLTVMDGKATRAVHGKAAVEQEVDVRIVAAGNSKDKIPPALMSRFIELDLVAYTAEERRAVIAGFLVTRRGLPADQAQEIADLVAPRGGDTRDADQIAGMWAQDPELARDMISRLGPVTAQVGKGTAPGPHRDRTGVAARVATD